MMLQTSPDPEMPTLAQLVTDRERRIVKLLDVLDAAIRQVPEPVADELRARERSVFADLNS